MDAPAGVTQEEGHTGFLHLPPAVLALIFIARTVQPSLSLVDYEVEFYEPANQSFSTMLCTIQVPVTDCAEIRTHVPTSEVFEVTS